MKDRKITDRSGYIGEWAAENEMKINTNTGKAIGFTRVRERYPLNYCLTNQNIPEADFCKYLRIIIQSDLRWAEQVYYRSIMHIVKREK
jgi:hypothetical protein